MSASYPGSIKSFTTKVDTSDDVLAADMNDVQNEIVALETELGINASKKLAKVWCYVTISGGTPTIAASNGLTSITDNGVGDFTATYTTAVASASHCTLATAGNYNANVQARSNPLSTTTARIGLWNTANAVTDSECFSFAAFGA